MIRLPLPKASRTFLSLHLVLFAGSFVVIVASNASAQEPLYPHRRIDAPQRYYPAQNPPKQYAALGLSHQQQAIDTSGPGGIGGPGGPEKKEGWHFSAGAGAMYGPAYEGSDKYKVMPLPDISVEYEDGLFFANLWDGIGSYPIQGEDYKLGASVGLDFGRDEKDDRKNLRGMGDIDMGTVGNLMGEYSFGPVRLSGKISKGGDDYGTTATVEVGTMFPVSDDLMMMAAAGPVWADDDHMNSRFGVSSAQATRSAYHRYEAESGVKSVGITVGAFYSITEDIDVKWMIKADQLLGDAADSPLVKDDFQPSTLLTVGYKF